MSTPGRTTTPRTAAAQISHHPTRLRFRHAVVTLVATFLSFGALVAVAKPTTPNSKAACHAAGGRWGAAGLLGVEQCDVRAGDAGASCNDDTECQSACVTGDGVPAGTPSKGHCYERSLSVGHCLNHVTGGTATGVVCAD